MHDMRSLESSIDDPGALEWAHRHPSRFEVTMPNSVLQIIMGDDIVASASGPEEVVATLKGAWPGLYVIEESRMAGKLLPSGYSCQRWGVAIRQADGTVMLEPEPAPTRASVEGMAADVEPVGLAGAASR
jgi:hypothetical protein